MNIIKKGDRVQTVTDTECNRAERRRKTMKFKKGDRVEVIWRSELHQGVVAQVVETTNEVVVELDKKPSIDYLFKQNQVSKVELAIVPQFVADYLADNINTTLYDVMNHETTDWCENYNEVKSWIQLNSEEFARAWLDGYEVEQEPLYYVRLPIMRSNTRRTAVEGVYNYLGADLVTGEIDIFQTIEYPATLIEGGWKTKFTEEQIKNMDKRYWAFAVPEEEVEGA
ncbi:TPA_asm: DUF1642 domain-containing protein [Listeria monocytogenes]|nr:DUF1642 domain-containing protein [Listeria monocytogenes]